MVAGLFLLTDLMLGRPPGLYAALSLLAFSNLSSRAITMRDMPFSVEWLTVAFAIAFVMLGHQLVLIILLVEPPAPALMFSQMAMTVLTYPLIAAITRFGFGLRPIGLGEINALGQRQ